MVNYPLPSKAAGKGFASSAIEPDRSREELFQRRRNCVDSRNLHEHAANSIGNGFGCASLARRENRNSAGVGFQVNDAESLMTRWQKGSGQNEQITRCQPFLELFPRNEAEKFYTIRQSQFVA
jgi:hypothetical protein